MAFTKTLLASACAISLLVSTPAEAYEFAPLVIELQPTGSGSSSSGVITNTHDEPIAIELTTFKRTQQSDGTDELVPETEDLIVMPPQMVIPPGESQTFRVQWVGDPNPERELAFRLISNQLPIRFKKEEREDYTAEVTMKYRYEAALYIEPRGTKPSAQLDAVRVVTSADGTSRELELTITSVGTRRAILDRPVIELAAGGSSVTLEGEQLAMLSGMNILPGTSRVIRIPAPAGLPSGSLSGSLKTSYLVVN